MSEEAVVYMWIEQARRQIHKEEIQLMCVAHPDFEQFLKEIGAISHQTLANGDTTIIVESTADPFELLAAFLAGSGVDIDALSKVMLNSLIDYYPAASSNYYVGASQFNRIPRMIRKFAGQRELSEADEPLDMSREQAKRFLDMLLALYPLADRNEAYIAAASCNWPNLVEEAMSRLDA